MTQNMNNIIISTLKEFYPERIGIFGSYAKEENPPESDLDILVRFKDGITLLQLINLENEH
ncbi:MAG: nucleotidyltransferase family protein [Bacteroidota bacterium]